MDISAACLKGMTFEEFESKETGTHLRSVQFDFPAADVWILLKLPGMADYDMGKMRMPIHVVGDNDGEF
eukprot:1960832-Prorocentrum_lima.AAC.1